MPTPAIWSPDDRVFNPAKPEWGTGRVTRVRAQSYQGVRCQMVTVRFDRAGVKNVMTGIAPLIAASDGPGRAAGPGSETSTGSARGLSESENPRPAGLPQHPKTPGELSQLPQAATDPSLPAADRLKTVLDLYRFTAESGRVPAGGSDSASGTRTPASQSSGAMVLAWAIAQTGLADPLSTFSRIELDAAFDAFVRRLDDQVRPLVRAVAAEDLTVFARIVGSVHSAGRAAAQRLVSRGSGQR